MSAISHLAHYIRTHGPIATARVSSAQARGRAKKYSYWGVVRYELRLSRDGRPINVALERASSDRRSERLVDQDCDALCDCEDRFRLQAIGAVGEHDAHDIMARLDPVGSARRDSRKTSTPRPLTLRKRLTVYVMAKRGFRVADPVGDVQAGVLRIDGRWLCHRGSPIAYRPYGDGRDVAEFSVEQNQHRRRLIVESCGDRVLPPESREMIQQDDYGQLWEITTIDPRRYYEVERQRQVRVVCPSTGAVYWLPTARSCRTAHEAVAASFGLSASDYQPTAEA